MKTLPQIEPALARGAYQPWMMTDAGWTAEIKYDGDRRLAHFVDGIVRFTGRKKSVKDGRYVEKTDNVPHLAHSASSMVTLGAWTVDAQLRKRVKDHLGGTVIDGEVICAGGRTPEAFRTEGKSKYVTSIMGSAPDVAIKKQLERGWLRYAAFDILFYRGADVREKPYADRRRILQGALREWENPYVDLSQRCLDDRKKSAWLDELWSLGEEGIVLKKITAPYGDRQAWVKRKHTATADAFIVGVKEAKQSSKKVDGRVSATRYAQNGWIGALVLAQYRDGKEWECATVNGLDDALRERITHAPQKFLRRVVRIEHNGREPSGRFRHPRFDGFRDDKSHRECLYNPSES